MKRQREAEEGTISDNVGGRDRKRKRSKSKGMGGEMGETKERRQAKGEGEEVVKWSTHTIYSLDGSPRLRGRGNFPAILYCLRGLGRGRGGLMRGKREEGWGGGMSHGYYLPYLRDATRL